MEIDRFSRECACKLHEVSSRYVGTLHRGILLFCDAHTPLVHLHLVTYLVVAQIFSVEHHIGKLSRWYEGLSQLLPYECRHGIPQQGLVGMVGQQSPALGIGVVRSQEPLFLMELQSVRFLGQSPGAVSSASDSQGVIGSYGVSLHAPHLCVFVCVFAVDSSSVVGVDIQGGQVGERMHPAGEQSCLHPLLLCQQCLIGSLQTGQHVLCDAGIIGILPLVQFVLQIADLLAEPHVQALSQHLGRVELDFGEVSE